MRSIKFDELENVRSRADLRGQHAAVTPGMVTAGAVTTQGQAPTAVGMPSLQDLPAVAHPPPPLRSDAKPSSK